MFDLIRPFSYLTVKHDTRLPLLVNLVVPALIALLMTCVICIFTPTLNVFSREGLLDRLLSFIQTLVGFYIAALAAVSSFNSPHLDRLMPQPIPEIYIKHNGKGSWVALTRRRFMTAMFAFLTAVSFLFSMVAIGVLTFSGPIAVAFPELVQVLRPVAIFVVLFGATQMTIVTFWGLYYLGERMLTPD